MTFRVTFRGSSNEARALAHELARSIGNATDPAGAGQAFLTALGWAALSDVKNAFITKARGGTDEMGIKWPPLKPETIARRRVGPKDRKNNPAIKAREKIVRAEVRKILPRLMASLPEAQARSRAKQIAERS